MLRSLAPDQFIMQQTSREKNNKMEPLLIVIFAKSNIDFNVVLYSILHLKPQVTDH